jgi:hypothetical protein
LEESVKFAQVMGLIKGDTRSGRLSHPYVWGWKRSSDWSTSYKAGWDPTPVWEYPGGIVRWVQLCGEEVAASQFPHSYPVMRNDKEIDEWVSRRLHRQRVIRLVEAECQTDLEMRNIHFEKRTRSCRPAFGDACEFLLACKNAAVEANPLGSGEYVPRVPHHEIEIQLEGGGE